ncbi:MAG: hypothetical protein IKR68_02905 [Lachnospiraceae bacterium]|nr:hypothetical protein [Lachnospiraceae bacterium]
MAYNGEIRFESPFAKQLYLEISGIQDTKKIDKRFISNEYIWDVWQKVYKYNFGCTSYILKDWGKKDE